MNTWLKISNGVVINVVTQDEVPPNDDLGDWVLQTNPMQGPGWFYDQNGVLTRPKNQPWFVITKQAFIDRFSESEWAAIQSASSSDSAVKESVDLISGLEKVILPSSSILRAIESFVNSGCILRERANDLIAPAEDGEEAEIVIPSVPQDGP
jgi:hypothetical protein